MHAIVPLVYAAFVTPVVMRTGRRRCQCPIRPWTLHSSVRVLTMPLPDGTGAAVAGGGALLLPDTDGGRAMSV